MNKNTFQLEMPSAAHHGIAGEFIRLYEPASEADPAAMLTQFMVAVGNAAGRHAHVLVESTKHHLNEYVAIVGASSKARKGTSWGRINEVMSAAAPEWAGECVGNSLSSGEGLVHAVRDSISIQEPIRRSGTVQGHQTVMIDPGVADKRHLSVLSEFGGVLRVMSRAGNALSATLRDAWDSGSLRVVTRTAPIRATGAHVSIIGHITMEELGQELRSTEAFNGFANRFMWIFARRRRLLPLGAAVPEAHVRTLASKVAQALKHARTVGEIRMDRQAEGIWTDIYYRLADDETGGLVGSVLARAEPHILRLSAIYAMLDRSAIIDADHMRAAEAVWSYSEASARYIFSEQRQNRVVPRVLEVVNARPEGISQKEIHQEFSGHLEGETLGEALAELQREGKVRLQKEATAGRSRNVWTPTRGGADEAEEAECLGQGD